MQLDLTDEETVVSQISLLAGKIQGISSMRGLSATSTAEKRGLSQSLTDQFPTHLNREFFWALQGIKPANSDADLNSGLKALPAATRWHPDEGPTRP
jgi:hypothetical protein